MAKACKPNLYISFKTGNIINDPTKKKYEILKNNIFSVRDDGFETYACHAK